LARLIVPVDGQRLLAQDDERVANRSASYGTGWTPTAGRPTLGGTVGSATSASSGHEVMAALEMPAAGVTADEIAFACVQVGSIADHFDIRMGSAMVFVRVVDAKPPHLAVFSPVLSGIRATPELFDALNDVNTRIRFGRVF